MSEVHLVELDLLGNLVNKDFQALRVILYVDLVSRHEL